MTTLETPIPTVSEHPEPSLVLTIARKELRDAVRGRWFWFYAAGFAIVASTLALVALPGAQVSGFGSFGRTAASLVALVQLIVPLMGLTLGAQSLAGQNERGTLRYLLSHPVSRTEAFLGTYLGLLAALFMTVAVGFGAAGLLTALRGSGTNAGAFMRIALLSWVLSAAMLGVGMLISSVARKGSSALGIAVFAWLALAFLGDLGIMGTAVATRLPVNALFASALLNPIEAFRLAALTSFSGSLDVLGPVGSYAIDRFGAALDPVIFAALVAWTILPLIAAWWFFAKRKDL
jgi:ABC-type transport system involved in multi-copper enzyme maturation permease subunit